MKWMKHPQFWIGASHWIRARKKPTPLKGFTTLQGLVLIFKVKVTMGVNVIKKNFLLI